MKHVILNPNRLHVNCALPLDPTRNARANPNRSYCVMMQDECLQSLRTYSEGRQPRPVTFARWSEE